MENKKQSTLTREEFLRRWSVEDSRRMREYVTECFSNITGEIVDDGIDDWKIREAREMEKARARDFRKYFSYK